MRSTTRHLPLLFGSVLAGILGLGFVLGATAGKDSIYRYLNVFAEVYSLVRSNYVDPVDEEALMQGACRGVAGGLDPFSGYLPRSEFQAVQKDPEGGKAVTGLEVLRIGGGAIIVAVRRGSPAERKGLRPGDQIWTIDGVPARQMSHLQVRRAQRGAPGSTAHMLIFHPANQKREEITIGREILASPSFESRLLDGRVGYVRIHDAPRAERDELKGALARLREEGAAQLLLDLRDAPGGSVEDAVRLAGLFLPPGTVVVVQDRNAGQSPRVSTSQPVWTLPVTVLVNGGSAGAAEMIAGSLRARLKTRIVGETSYGLATTQQLVPLPSGDGLVLSSAKLLTPDGESWSKGLTPDDEIPSTLEERAGLEADRQLEKTLALLRQPAAAQAA